VLALHEVNYSGEAVVAVVAESVYEAQDAAAAIEVDYEPLPAIADVVEAARDDAPKVHDQGGSNVAKVAHYEFGDIDAAFTGAPITVKERFAAARICGAAMEPRVATAHWLPDEGSITVWSSTQGVFSVRDTVAEALGLEAENVTVLAHDVGGGFGPKGTVYSEEVLVSVLARMTERPVTWSATRSEDTATTVQAHGARFEIEVAAEADGRLRGLRGRMWHDLGAYPGPGNGQPDIVIPHMLSAYRWPAMNVDVTLVYTNAAPTGFVRGGGRPLGNWIAERMLDRVAEAAGADPAEVRRRNLIPADQMPYDTRFPQGRRTIVYDGGDYPRLLETALKEIGYDDLRRQQQDRRQNGGARPLGIGIACCVESSGFGSGEPARVRIQPDGVAHLYIGSTPQGQGHDTSAAQVLADRLGWPLERIEVVSADSRVVPWALFTAGSRTAIHVGNAVSMAAKSARDRILEKAAERLEADPVDLVIEDAVVSVKGVPGRNVAVTDLFPHGLEVEEAFNTRQGTAYSSNCHACALEVDPETGSVHLLRYVIVHDTGRVINPMLVEGQMEGGLAHGLGYALFEEAIYQPDGSFQTASFLDYTIASAPEVKLDLRLVPVVTPTEANPEGFKGAGESGAISSPGAVCNAIEDAIRQLKPEAAVTEIPVTPLRLYRLLEA
jgi:carbon-monoxide dehydrogenase large subunit